MDYGDSALHTSAQPGRAVPFSLEAEQSVLGAILLEPSCPERGHGPAAPGGVLLRGEQTS